MLRHQPAPRIAFLLRRHGALSAQPRITAHLHWLAREHPGEVKQDPRSRALRAATALCLAAIVAACGGGGGGSSSSSSAGATTGSGPGTPGTVSLADVGSYPARPTTVTVGSSGSTGSTGSAGTGTGSGTGSGSSGTGSTGSTGSTGTSGSAASGNAGSAGTVVHADGSSGTAGATISVGNVSLPAYVPTGPKILVLYDAPAGSEWQKLGVSYAIMLRNLLGHFDADVDMVPVQNYAAGQIAAHQATFYLGSDYDNPLPTAFLADAAASSKPLVWFKYNLWQLTDNSAYQFSAAHGFTFHELRGMNARPTAAAGTPGFFDTVEYKGLDFDKYYNYNAQTDTIIADPDIGTTTITDATKASEVVAIRNF